MDDKTLFDTYGLRNESDKTLVLTAAKEVLSKQESASLRVIPRVVAFQENQISHRFVPVLDIANLLRFHTEAVLSRYSHITETWEVCLKLTDLQPLEKYSYLFWLVEIPETETAEEAIIRLEALAEEEYGYQLLGKVKAQRLDDVSQYLTPYGLEFKQGSSFARPDNGDYERCKKLLTKWVHSYYSRGLPLPHDLSEACQTLAYDFCLGPEHSFEVFSIDPIWFDFHVSPPPCQFSFLSLLLKSQRAEHFQLFGSPVSQEPLARRFRAFVHQLTSLLQRELERYVNTSGIVTITKQELQERR